MKKRGRGEPRAVLAKPEPLSPKEVLLATRHSPLATTSSVVAVAAGEFADYVAYEVFGVAE